MIAPAVPPEKRFDRGGLRFDVHVHLAGVGTRGSGCWMSPAFRRRPSFLGLRLLHRIGARQMRDNVDQVWAARISALTAASDLDFAAVLGFDGVYDSRGRLDLGRSQLLVPPAWVFEVCERYPNLLPGPSINPYRRDALDVLEAAIEAGAVLIKWLPIVQGFDPASSRVRPFLERLAEAGVPLLVHAGSGEVTFRTVDRDVGRVEDLVPALEAGVRVICAHAASRIHLSLERDQRPALRQLLARYPNLWVDNSGLSNPSRFRHLPRIAADPLIAERTLHGSDFPVLSNAFYYPRRIPVRELYRIERERNALQRELRIKQSLGFPEATFNRASAVLSQLDRWIPRTIASGEGRA